MDENKKQYWLDHIEAANRFEGTQAEYCAKHGIKAASLSACSTPMEKVVENLNGKVAGWVNYFRVGNSSRAFSEVRDYLEMKVRILLTRRKRRQKRSIGWKRWSNEYLYGVLGLYWDWKLKPLPSADAYR